MLQTVAAPVSNRSVGLFGGTFDPPHCGHEAVVQAGLALGLDEIWVVPANPVHRELSGGADGETRFLWLEKIFESESRVKVLDWEIKCQKPTPTVDTLRRIQADYPSVTPWLMLGADAWNGLESWQAYPAHVTMCSVMVFRRQGLRDEAFQAHQNWQQVHSGCWSDYSQPGCCCFIDTDLPDVSATAIRSRAGKGCSLKGLVPSQICGDIENNYAVMKEKM